LRLIDVAHVRVPKGVEGQRTRVNTGDLLITITGANVTKAALVKSEIDEAYVNQHLALLRPVEPQVSEFMGNYILEAEPELGG
jgi:type I restriction enzyme S subunit